MRRFAHTFAVVFLSSASLAAHAQVCTGSASFRSGPVRIAAGIGVSDGLNSYGASLGAGAPTGIFGSAGIVRFEFRGNGITSAAVRLNLEGGYAIDLTPAKSMQFCPLASFGYESEPDSKSVAGTITSSTRLVGFGGSFGRLMPMTPTVDFVPFARVQYFTTRTSGGISGFPPVSFSDHYTAVDIGAGFVVNRTLTLQPSVSIPVGLDGGKALFQIGVSFNLGASSAQQ
jgi:hypothetical protein